MVNDKGHVIKWFDDDCIRYLCSNCDVEFKSNEQGKSREIAKRIVRDNGNGSMNCPHCLALLKGFFTM